MPEVFTTAHDALFTQAELEPGEHLLVHGGAGGVGTAAIQLGRAAGARVTATVRNQDLREQVAALGADVIAPEGFGEHGPFDVILELVGAPNLARQRRTRSRIGGRIVVDRHRRRGEGRAAPRRADGQARAHPRLDAPPAPARGEGADRAGGGALGAAAAGEREPRVPVAARYPLDQAEAAYERFAAGGKLGKIVLEMG